MKNFIAFTAILASSSVFAKVETLAFTQIIISKDSHRATEIPYVANRSVKTWCTGYGSNLAIGSFEAAQTLDGLADGLYSCDGKFVQAQGERNNGLQVFEIAACHTVNSVDLKTDCPTPTSK
jgi:hypothetical protein